MISVRFQGKPFNTTVIQVCTPTTNAKEAEIEQFCEDLQDLLELTPKKDVLFIIGDWNAKARSQETPGVTGKFGLGMQNEAGQRLTEFCQENTLVTAKAPSFNNTRDNSTYGHHQMVNSESESEVAQSCPTLCDPMDCSLPSSSLHGILQARVLEWVAISF